MMLYSTLLYMKENIIMSEYIGYARSEDLLMKKLNCFATSLSVKIWIRVLLRIFIVLHFGVQSLLFATIVYC